MPEVGHQVWDAELARPVELGLQGVHGLPVVRALRRGEVREAWYVVHGEPDAAFLDLLPEGRDLLIGEILEAPAPGVPGEDLEGVAPDLLRPVHGEVDRLRDGDMHANGDHGLGILLYLSRGRGGDKGYGGVSILLN